MSRRRCVKAILGPRPPNIAAVALAYKTARIIWAALAKGETLIRSPNFPDRL
jgi:hypothetical protein